MLGLQTSNLLFLCMTMNFNHCFKGGGYYGCIGCGLPVSLPFIFLSTGACNGVMMRCTWPEKFRSLQLTSDLGGKLLEGGLL